MAKTAKEKSSKEKTKKDKEPNKYLSRMEKVRSWMIKEGIALIMLEDTETRRDQNIRWLTGQPGDSLFFLSQEGKAALVAWDVNMANLYAKESGAAILAYDDFDRRPLKAIAKITRLMEIPHGSKIDLPSVTSYPAFLKYVGELSDYDILCNENGAASEINKLRAVKDDEEIALYRKASLITNEIIDSIEKKVISGKIKTEADAALFIELESRKMGCEGSSFETLAAGPQRSFGIHAFPAWTNAPFGGSGLSILDFGVKLDGYCTDVTLTVARGLNPIQEKMVSLVEKAAKLTLPMAHNGTPAKDIAKAVDAFFAKSNKKMPHGLGHGIGLQPHEYPPIRSSSDNEWTLSPGMIFTIEPGLYDPLLGGCRLENDFLITESGYEILTTSRIIRL